MTEKIVKSIKLNKGRKYALKIFRLKRKKSFQVGREEF